MTVGETHRSGGATFRAGKREPTGSVAIVIKDEALNVPHVIAPFPPGFFLKLRTTTRQMENTRWWCATPRGEPCGP
jgi:hypothetical protein